MTNEIYIKSRLFIYVKDYFLILKIIFFNIKDKFLILKIISLQLKWNNKSIFRFQFLESYYYIFSLNNKILEKKVYSSKILFVISDL